MKKSRKFVSMPIVSLEEGMQIGSVRNLIVDPAKMEIAAIIVDQRGWFREQKIIPYTKVKSIGNDAVTIDQSANVQKTISLPEMLKLIKERANPIGTRVIAENGTVLGIVDEYDIDEATGKITGLEISGKMLESLFKGKALLPIEYVRTLGSDVIVVRNDAQSHLEKIDGGLQETIHNIKESTSSLFESTLQRTKELNKKIKDKYEKREKEKAAAQEDASEITAEEPPAPESTIEPEPSLDITGEVEIKDASVVPGIIQPEHLPEEAPAEPEKKDGAADDNAPTGAQNPETKE